MLSSTTLFQRLALVGAVSAVLALGCEQSTGNGPVPSGGGTDSGTLSDGAAQDASATDASGGDTGAPPDSAQSDAGPADAAAADATPLPDATLVDTPAGPDAQAGCPPSPPIGGKCDQQNLQCQFGQECCCGKCSPSTVCTCNSGSWACMATDACMLPPGSCPDAGGGGGKDGMGDGGGGGFACTNNAACPPEFFCKQAAGACGGTGNCTLKPTTCTKEYAPVCGCDGVTYGNPCEASAKGASVKQSGACGGPPPTGCDVAAQTGCAAGEYCSAPGGGCSGQGVCAKKPDMCTTLYDPVCGCNNQTYSNSCAAAGNGQNVKAKGACAPTPSGCDAKTQTGCAAGQYCKAPAGSLCSGQGTCTAMSQICPSIYAPVCGCDGKTYGNDCEAGGAGQNVLSKGACASGSALQWYLTCGAPVCSGWKPDPSIPLCTTEKAGDPCKVPGGLCDPQDQCGAKLKCTDSDPKTSAGGCPISKAKYKSDIRYLQTADSRELAERLLATKLATYRYTATGPQGKRQLGFIIDDDPESPAVDAQRDMVDLYGYLSMAVATLQVQQQKIDTLQKEVASLRAGVCGAATLPMSK